MAKGGIPFSSESSPSQVDRVVVLNMLQSTVGNSISLLKAVQAMWFSKAVVVKDVQLSLLACGIIADGSGPDDKGSKRHELFHRTDAGKRILALRDYPDALYATPDGQARRGSACRGDEVRPGGHSDIHRVPCLAAVGQSKVAAGPGGDVHSCAIYRSLTDCSLVGCLR